MGYRKKSKLETVTVPERPVIVNAAGERRKVMEVSDGFYKVSEMHLEGYYSYIPAYKIGGEWKLKDDNAN